MSDTADSLRDSLGFAALPVLLLFPIRLLQSVGGLSVQHVISNYDVLRTAKHNTVYETKCRGRLERVRSNYRYEM